MSLRFGLLVCLFTIVPALASAQGFLRTTTCNTAGAINACDPGESPKPLEWPRNCITFYLNEAGADDIDGDGPIAQSVIDASTAGFLEWNTPESSAFTYVYGGLTNENRTEWVPKRGRSGNANIVVWREDWPDDFSQTAYAITSVSFNPETAEILDADIELNSEFHTFTVSDEDPIVDIQNTLTHESGHFLGLDHVSDRNNTMFGSARLSETKKRTLEEGDIEGVSTIYPAGTGAETCDEPDDYFEKPSNEDGGCCTSVDNGRPSSTPAILALLFLAGFVVRRCLNRRSS